MAICHKTRTKGMHASTFRRALAVILVGCLPALGLAQTDRPNILWLSVEDMGPHVGAYGYPHVETPNLDALAERALRYTAAWSSAPVCAPARTTIISGISAVSIGGQHHRSGVSLPDDFQMFPQYLQTAGYYSTNNAKEDYNLRKPGKVWDESSRQAHYRNRENDQPFFAVFNNHDPHESRIHGHRDEVKEIPEDFSVPDHHPDIPEMRRDWETYHRRIAEMDDWLGRKLAELEEAGLREETIVFFWGDHGSPLPRHKRWPYQSGLHVPLLVYVPSKYHYLAPDDYSPGTATDRLVGFEDLGPTVLSLAGLEPPGHMHGRPFMGKYETDRRDYLFGFSGRMDERFDMVRTVRDERYQYIRNYMPHRVYGQYLEYMFRTPTPGAWKSLYEAGRLNPPLTFFWERKPPEELYDIENDPDQVHNLAYAPGHQEIRKKLRRALREHILEIRDTGFLPEAQVHHRSQEDSPYTMAHDRNRYPLRRIYETAELAANYNPDDVPELARRLSADDSAVRYWAAMGLLIRGQHAGWPHREKLSRMMSDDDPSVRVVAAEALVEHGTEKDFHNGLQELLELSDIRDYNILTVLAALNVIDRLGARAELIFDELKKLPRRGEDMPWRYEDYIERMFDKYFSHLDE
jgi:uncharacterized sulfatase